MVNEVFGVSSLNEKKQKFNINEGVRKKTTLMIISFETMTVIKKSPSQSRLLAGTAGLLQTNAVQLMNLNVNELYHAQINKHNCVPLLSSLTLYQCTYVLGRCNTGR